MGDKHGRPPVAVIIFLNFDLVASINFVIGEYVDFPNHVMVLIKSLCFDVLGFKVGRRFRCPSTVSSTETATPSDSTRFSATSTSPCTTTSSFHSQRQMSR